MGNFFVYQKKSCVKKKIYIKGHYRHFLSKTLFLTVPKVSTREPFNVAESIDYRESFCIKWVYHGFLWKIFCRSVSKVFLGISLRIRKFLVSKKNMQKSASWPSPVEIFLSHFAKTLHTGTLQCFRMFRVSEKFPRKKGISRFSVDTFLSHSVEGIRGDFFCVSEKFWSRKNLHIKEHYGPFPSKLFLSHSGKKFRRGSPAVFQKVSVVEEVYA